MRLAGKKSLPAGRNMIHIGIAFRQLGQPYGGRLFHFALRQFPEFFRIDKRCQLVPYTLALRQKRTGVIPAHRRAILRAGPGQNAVCGQSRFPPIGQKQTQLTFLFLHNPSYLRSIALQEFHNATGAGITHKSRITSQSHSHLPGSFSGTAHPTAQRPSTRKRAVSFKNKYTIHAHLTARSYPSSIRRRTPPAHG